ncbi:phage portal protein [uncultured Ramlibacter sp.]|uniref:phage portal protein n=1 Tax=uncultured Ramlibacter sp. TaxID=260755 RepID=UPI00260AF4CF|nr:phage portal protein [uncultured Ramlibacter sp.]
MGFLADAVAEQKSAGNVWERWVQLMDLGRQSKAGPSVTLDSAFRVSAALACMREISQGLAQVPFKLMQDYEEGGLERKRAARKHPAYKLMTVSPDGRLTSFEFIETMGLHASLGNAYAFKGMYRGKLGEVFLLDPARCRAEQQEDWSVRYFVRGKSGEEQEIPASQIWHLRGPSWNGVLGLDVLNLARESLGLSMALEESAASLHANGVRPSGVYSVEGTLNDTQQKQLTAWLKKEAGANNTGTPLVLDRAAKWLSTAMTSVDAQHREMRQDQVEDVCRFFGVLPTIVGFTGDKANTYASAEIMENAHKVRTLGRWYKRVQDSANLHLLTDADRDSGHYFKFITNALMASSAKDRGDFYAKALGSGGSPAWMSQDEVRALDDLDPFGGEAAKLPPLQNQAKPAPQTA